MPKPTTRAQKLRKGAEKKLPRTSPGTKKAHGKMLRNAKKRKGEY